MDQLVTLHDKHFKVFISEQEIAETVNRMATNIKTDLGERQPFFLVVLSGAVVFAADLIRAFARPCELDFVKASSYDGTSSKGSVDLEFRWKQNLEGKAVIIVEDIVETGNTITRLYAELQKAGAASIRVASFLFKKDRYHQAHPIDYYGLSIGNEFVVGYGLDYNGLGRELKQLYVLA